MDKDTFERRAKLAGFTNPNQVEFMWKYLAKISHTHEIEEIMELEDVLEDLGVWIRE